MRVHLASALVLLAWALTACTSWQSLPSPQPFPRGAEQVQVLTPSGQKVSLWYPVVRRDTLFGAMKPDRRGRPDIRLGNVPSLRVRRFSAGRTALLVGGILVGIPVVAWLGFRIAGSSGVNTGGFGL